MPTHILRKLNATNRTQAVAISMKLGFLEPEETKTEILVLSFLIKQRTGIRDFLKLLDDFRDEKCSALAALLRARLQIENTKET
jgi:ABC-type taurine transport system ATPase subunit